MKKIGGFVLLAKLIKSEQGAAMAVVLIVILVGSLLAFSLWSYSMFELRSTTVTENKMQAHYLARSGAEIIAHEIITSEGGSAILDYLNDPANAANPVIKTEPTSLGAGVFSVVVEPYDDSKVKITSTGEVGSTSDSVVLVINTNEQISLFDNAIFAVSDISLTSSHVHGDVESKGLITGTPDTGTTKEGSLKVYYSATLPVEQAAMLDDRSGMISSNSNNNYSLSKTINPNGVYLGDVDMGPNGSLEVVVPQDETFIILADQFFCKGGIDVVSDILGGEPGVVMIFVRSNGEIKTKSTTVPEKVIVFLYPNLVFNLQSNAEFNGYIYGPEAVVTIQSAHTTVNGAIIAKALYSQHNNSNQTQPFSGRVNHVYRPALDIAAISNFIPNVPTETFYQKFRWER